MRSNKTLIIVGGSNVATPLRVGDAMLHAESSHSGRPLHLRTRVKNAVDDCCHHAAPAADASFCCLRKGALSPKSVAASA